jgi:hypothetical protein
MARAHTAFGLLFSVGAAGFKPTASSSRTRVERDDQYQLVVTVTCSWVAASGALVATGTGRLLIFCSLWSARLRGRASTNKSSCVLAKNGMGTAGTSRGWVPRTRHGTWCPAG